MRKIKSLSIAFICIMACFLAMSTAAYAQGYIAYENTETGYYATIQDDEDLLSDSEEQQLAETMKEATEYCNAAFVTIGSNNYSSTRAFAEAYYESVFGSSNGTLFIIDMDYRQLYVYTHGDASGRITSSKADTITDNIYRMASNGQYFECANEAFSEIGSILRGERISQPMKYINNILLALIIAMIVNFIIVKNASRMHAASDKAMLESAEIDFHASSPNIRYTHTTREYSPRSSGSGGSGGGGGGGSSGGGHGF